MQNEVTNYQTVFVVPETAVPFFEKALDSLTIALSGSLIEEGPDKDCWRMDAIFEGKPDEEYLRVVMSIASLSANIDEPKWKITPVPKKNWLRECLVNFPPIELGDYYIYGSHIKEKPPKKKIALKIDAATAFGSGEHATTQGCLKGFDDLLKKTTPKRILDMGCGSGILSMAAAKKIGKSLTSIDAVDIDDEAVRVTQINVKKNRVLSKINVFQSTGYEKIKGKYDLVFANILARPLMDMAPDLTAHLKSGGYAILSGFLTSQKSWVLKAHKKAGLSFVKNYAIGEWGTLVVKKD